MPPPKKHSGGQKKDTPSPPPAAAQATSGNPGSAKGKTNATDVGRIAPKSSKSGRQQAMETPPSAGTTKMQITGEQSWTGKLPVDLLAEHCRKSGWGDRPDYKIRRFPDGYLGSVTLRWKNPKTNIVEEVQFTPPREMKAASGEVVAMHQQTILEAKHFLATYTLNRVANMVNVNFMLPPSHQAFWKVFEVNRRHDISNGKHWLYAVDPFRAQRERKALMEKLEKERLAKTAAAEAAALTGELYIGGRPPGVGNWNERVKGWKHVPAVEMGKDIRAEVEDLVRSYHVWNPDGIKMSEEARKQAVEELVGLGFRRSHVEEGCEWVGDKQECLEWLIVHIPEDDLPPRFLPDSYTVGITAGNLSLAQEYAAKRLSVAGYSLELCCSVLQQHGGNEVFAAEQLQHLLLNRPFKAELDLLDFEEGDPWEEEQGMLEVCFGLPIDTELEQHENKARFTRVSPTLSKIQLELDSIPPTHMKHLVPEEIWLHVQKPITGYPMACIPIITIVTEGRIKLPAHIRLSIIRQAATYALEKLLGEQMVYSIADWLGTNIMRIIEHPGRLRDLTSAITRLENVSEVVRRKPLKQIRKKLTPIQWVPGSPASNAIYNHWQERLAEPAMQRMLQFRRTLPAWGKRERILSVVNSAQVTIITGETGSGKSTQSVQFILDDLIQRRLGESCNIVCTQPRRISALGLASRVAEERGSTVGQEVGYVIGGDSKSKRGTTKITFVTTGVLLRRMQMAGAGAQGGEGVLGGLDEVSHVVVDEVHERSLDTDLLLVLLKRALSIRNDLKVVLMSATMDAATFAKYFLMDRISVDVVEVEGRMFPVQDFYLDDIIKKTQFELFSGPQKGPTEAGIDGSIDPYVAATIRAMGNRINYALIAQTILYIDTDLARKDGGILIFLPGSMEIKRTLEAIQRLPSGNSRYHALPLHASLTPQEQQAVFPPAPQGKRKVICATNVAETSITIPDIVAVIDTGRVKEISYSPDSDMVRLLETWASRAACRQRKGRAGRVRAGCCYKLFMRAMEEQKMPERPEPEVRRVPLQQACLRVKAMGVKDVRGFLASAITPPETEAVEEALKLLGKVGALKGEELTNLGKYMSMIPADLKCAKLLVYGAIFGCLDMALTIAAVLSTKSPFISPLEKRDKAKVAKMRFAGPHGDLIADAIAYWNWAQMRLTTSTGNVKLWCDSYFLSHHALLDIASTKAQLLSALKESGLVHVEYELPNLRPPPLGPGSIAISPPQPSPKLMDINPVTASTTSQPAQASSVDLLTHHNNSFSLIRAIIGAAFTPHIARIQMPDKRFQQISSGAVEVDPEARMIKYFDGPGGAGGGGRVFVHPGSTLFDAKSFVGEASFVAWWVKMSVGRQEELTAAAGLQRGAVSAPAVAGTVLGAEQVKEKVTIRELTPVGTYPLLLLGGELRVDTLGRGMIVDGWIRVQGWGRIGVLVGMVRKLIEEVLKDRFIVGNSETPKAQTGMVEDAERKRLVKEREVMNLVRKLIEGEGH